MAFKKHPFMKDFLTKIWGIYERFPIADGIILAGSPLGSLLPQLLVLQVQGFKLRIQVVKGQHGPWLELVIFHWWKPLKTAKICERISDDSSAFKCLDYSTDAVHIATGRGSNILSWNAKSSGWKCQKDSKGFSIYSSSDRWHPRL